MSLENEPTFVVELTPPGRAAVAVVLIDGPAAVRAVGECFVSATGRPLADVPIRRIVFGRWGGPEGEELVVCRRTESQIEVHCHGGTAAVAAVVGSLAERGCRVVSWREWLRSPRIPGSEEFEGRLAEDAIAREAHIALAGATTFRPAAVLLDQYRGALSRAIRAAIEAVRAENERQASSIIGSMLHFSDVGLHLTKPWRVVMAGAPNVGKSSLINALAGYERSIVSPQPGTTRDVVTMVTAIDGWPVELADTAGLRAAADQLESAGVALAAEAMAEADLVVAVQDASMDNETNIGGNNGSGLFGALSAARLIHVYNKLDLLGEAKRRQYISAGALATSALTGEGIAALAGAIGKSLVPQPPPAEAAVPFTAQQIAALETATEAIRRRDLPAAENALQAMLSVTLL